MDNDDNMADMGYPRVPSSGSRTPRRPNNQPPQEALKQFWEHFNTRFPGKVYTVLPDNPYARTKAARIPTGQIIGQNAAGSYDQARSNCIQSVHRIVQECQRVNQKYTDPHFDIEVDLKSRRRDYLDGLDEVKLEMQPKGVKRVTEIFENPQFYVNGPTASDVRQGRDGDCWFMAALCTMGNKQGLIDNICVARDEKVGVYGFVFFREAGCTKDKVQDGEWQQYIVDDKLYLRAADYFESFEERQVWDDITRADPEEEYRKVWQTGSRALYFAQCVDENETWLPLLEKAYAKAHGDYSSIEGGFVGEAIEDLTGGVTMDILSSSILDKDRFWKEELMNVNKEFLFGCGTGLWSNWLYPKYEGPPRDRKGISENHSYSIMDATELDGVRLLRLRNPWGKKEWNGAWSDGSPEWTPERMEKLGHTFGNDGLFWISYDDLLKKYQHLDRTRLFGPEWTVTQQWTTLNVPWSADYHGTKFLITVRKKSPLVIVLSQLDPRYFKGLAGEYDFVLKFRVQKEGKHDYIVRSQSSHLMSRSVNVEINLEPGRYYVYMKITAFRHSGVDSTEEAVSRLASNRREKLVQIGLSYDLAHAKGRVVQDDSEKRKREEYERTRKEAERKNLRDETERKLKREWIKERKLARRKRRVAEIRAKESQQAVHSQKPRENGIGLVGIGIQNSNIAQADPASYYPSPKGADHLGSNNHSNSEQRPSPDPRFLSVQSSSSNPQRRNPCKRKRELESRRPSVDTFLAVDGIEGSDQEYLEGFEFDPDLDMPEDPPTMDKPSRTSTFASSYCEDFQPSADPWNAVCVVGLRVYSKDRQLSLEVVRPLVESEAEASLDMDDPAVSATNEFKFFVD